MALWIVTHAVEIVVESATEPDRRSAERFVSEAIRDGGAGPATIDVRPFDGLPRGWDGRALPYGGDGETTIAQLMIASRVTVDGREGKEE